MMKMHLNITTLAPVNLLLLITYFANVFAQQVTLINNQLRLVKQLPIAIC